MAIWYVSVTTGNDSNDATTIANACATITKAAELVGSDGLAGDTIYIAPGTYRGQVDMNDSGDGLDGTAAAPVKWVGDPNSEIFTAIEPGIVRLTGTDENNMPYQATATWMVLDIRNRDYNHFYNLSFDGTTYGSTHTGYCFYTDSGGMTQGNSFFNCIFQSSNIAGRYAELVQNCVVIGCGYGLYQVGTVLNTVLIGQGSYPIFACPTAHNNLVIGGAAGIWSSGARGSYINNTVVGCNIGHHVHNSGGKATFWNSFMLGCTIGMKGQANNYTHATGSYYTAVPKLGQRGHHDIIHAGGAIYNGDNWNVHDHENADFIYRPAKVTLWGYNNIRDIARNLKPTVFTDGLKGIGTATYNYADTGDEYTTALAQYDILGHPRDMGEPSSSHDKAYASTRDAGCWEYSNVYITSSAAGQVTMSIEGEGQFAIPIAVASGSSVTASADIKLKTTNALASLLKPQFILRQRSTEPSSSYSFIGETYAYPSGAILELDTATSTAASDVYSNLTIKAGPMKRDTILEAVLYSRTTGSASTSSMSNIVIQ